MADPRFQQVDMSGLQEQLRLFRQVPKPKPENVNIQLDPEVIESQKQTIRVQAEEEQAKIDRLVDERDSLDEKAAFPLWSEWTNTPDWDDASYEERVKGHDQYWSNAASTLDLPSSTLGKMYSITRGRIEDERVLGNYEIDRDEVINFFGGADPSLKAGRINFDAESRIGNDKYKIKDLLAGNDAQRRALTNQIYLLKRGIHPEFSQGSEDVQKEVADDLVERINLFELPDVAERVNREIATNLIQSDQTHTATEVENQRKLEMQVRAMNEIPPRRLAVISDTMAQEKGVSPSRFMTRVNTSMPIDDEQIKAIQKYFVSPEQRKAFLDGDQSIITPDQFAFLPNLSLMGHEEMSEMMIEARRIESSKGNNPHFASFNPQEQMIIANMFRDRVQQLTFLPNNPVTGDIDIKTPEGKMRALEMMDERNRPQVNRENVNIQRTTAREDLEQELDRIPSLEESRDQAFGDLQSQIPNEDVPIRERFRRGFLNFESKVGDFFRGIDGS